MIKELIKLANHLDSKGYPKEADTLDKVINKMAGPLSYVAKNVGGEGDSDVEGSSIEAQRGAGDVSKELREVGTEVAKRLSDSAISEELAALIELHPNEETSDINEQDLRNKLHGPDYLGGVLLEQLDSETKRMLHKKLRFDSNFKHDLTTEPGDAEVLSERNLGLGE